MPVKLRIATFNLENLDDKPDEKPTLDERIAVMRPQLIRLNADTLCLHEVNGQEGQGSRQLLVKETFRRNALHQLSSISHKDCGWKASFR